jgi:glycosyltransferase involved in cell wall biosynthesis
MINNAALLNPYHLVEPGAWIGHIPFASWLVAVLKPSILVELGTHTGNSYMAFCQAIEENNIATKAYAVDTWEGDEHAGKYDGSVFSDLKSSHDSRYRSFSSLLRMTFDQALGRFADRSIDLLHIDGLHTYDAVKHDFFTWLPKVSRRGVVLFHDTNVRERNFGVHQLWTELSATYPGFNFEHCHGLGVLLVGDDRAAELYELAVPPAMNSKWVLTDRLFQVLGGNIEGRLKIDSLTATVDKGNKEIARLNAALGERDAEIARLNTALRKRDVEIARLNGAVAERDGQIVSLTLSLQAIYDSTSWQLLAPLRWCGRQRVRVLRVLRALPSALTRAGGVFPLLNIIVRVWRSDGTAGVRALVRQYLEKTSRAHQEVGTVISVDDESGLAIRKDGRPGILFVSHEASRSGAPIFLLALIRFLKIRLDINCVILLCCGGDLEQDFRALGPTYVSSSRDELDPMVWHSLKKHNIDLVYSNTITNGQVQKRLEGLGRPIFCHVHELAFSIESHFGEHNLRRVLESTTLFLAGSKAVAVYLREQQNLPESKVALVYPFIDVQKNMEIASSCPRLLDIRKDAVVIGACGTIGWRKGTDLFVQVARLALASTKKSLVFVWVGGPLSHGEYSNVRHDANLMGIDSHLIFTGAVDSHIPYFTQFDIFVLPSREDPFPLVVLDAASLSIPVVCFDSAGGAIELVEHDAGRIVPYLNLEQMSAAIVELAEDEPLRRRLGDCGRIKVQTCHDKELGGKHIADIIKPFLKNS